jgi:DNA-binding transcriptional regulator PaaX
MYEKKATGKPRDFREAYPLSAKGAVYNFLILRDGAPFLAAAPYPSLSTIREFAFYAGISDSAIRTLLSREGRAGYIRKEKDEAGIMRYRLAEPALVLGMINSRRDALPEGFIVAVFSFTADAAGERSIVRETLKNFGFKKIAQNVYLNGRIDTAPLRAAMRELGLDSHLYLFSCPELEDEALVRRVIGLFELDARAAELAAFERAMLAFVDGAEPSDRDESARRLVYAGLVFWERFKTTEPPLPARLLPEGYRYAAIASAYAERYAARAPAITEYYERISAR